MEVEEEEEDAEEAVDDDKQERGKGGVVAGEAGEVLLPSPPAPLRGARGGSRANVLGRGRGEGGGVGVSLSPAHMWT